MTGNHEDLVRRLRETRIEWYFSFDSDDDTLTFRAIVDGATYKLRTHPGGGLGYTLLVHGRRIADIAISQWPVEWELVGFGKRQNAASAEAGPTIEAEQIRAWAERLCQSSGGPAEMAAALGLEGPLVDHAPLDYATMESPPAGASQVVLSRGRHGVDYVRLQFDNCVATRSQLDTLLGDSMNVPAVHPSGTFTIGYRVEVPGALSMCSVFVDFEYPDTPASLTSRVTLRRDHISESSDRG
jgi:hypothetical protein